MFRASNDGGATFGDKINLSNTTDADSSKVEIAGQGADVAVTRWETNQTSDTPVARLSSDGGQTFGPMLRLGINGTIDSVEEVGGEGGAVEEAVRGQKLQSSSSIIQTALPRNTLYLANMKTLFFSSPLTFLLEEETQHDTMLVKN